MKKSREIVLLITSSIALSACDQKPTSTRNPLTAISPTPTATPGRSGGYGASYYGGYGSSSSTGTSSGKSSTVSRGGFGAHGSSGAS